MKLLKFTTLFLMLLVFAIANSQEPEAKVSKERIKETVEEVINDDYVRIPKKDFDAIIESRLSNLVNSKINTLIGLTLGVIGLLSAFSIVQANRSRNVLKEYFETRIDNEITKAVNTIKEDYIKAIDPKIDSLKLELKNEDVRIINSVDEIKNEVSRKLVSMEQQNEQTKRQVSRAEDYLTNVEMTNLREKIDSKSYISNKDDINIAYKLLDDIKASNTNLSRIPTIISYLSNMLYNMNHKEYDNQLIDLIAKYEKEFELTQSTYVNGGLISFNIYHKFASAHHQRENALLFLDKSLKTADGYGIALALKLEIFMMDYQRSVSKKEEKEAYGNAQKVIKDILNSKSDLAAYETLQRLIQDFANEKVSIRPEIDQLYSLFPDDMRSMVEKANKINVSKGWPLFTISQISSVEANL